MTRYRDEVTPEHVGNRVTVRHLVDDDGREVPTDVVGELVSADAMTFTVRRRSGEEVVVDRARLVASKLIPAAPPRRRPGRPT
ncbi:hypothetical protein [Salsipaludibacter albus]|uniref:putative acetyltransferase n=1 Tax=Salsipaludibacter albus TaxID=2849650 RepID=UPI001EE4808D|nr:hypothetical protein [Salsipaludibacter albus]MBY5163331.1 hypothetical protein [Salsipaludibacter albus]